MPPDVSSSETDDPWFVQTVMYHGRTSRRPGLRLGLGLAFGLAITAGGLFIYTDLAAWEAAGRPTRSMTSAVALLYQIGGKALPAGVGLAAGLWFAGMAVRGFLADRRVAEGQTG